MHLHTISVIGRRKVLIYCLVADKIINISNGLVPWPLCKITFGKLKALTGGQMMLNSTGRIDEKF